MEKTDAILPSLADLAGLTVFRPCRSYPLLRAFCSLLMEWSQVSAALAPAVVQARPLTLLRRWSGLVRALAETADATAAFPSAVRDIALFSDNSFTLAAEGLDLAAIPPLLAQLARDDLDRLGRIAAFDIPALGFQIAQYLRSRSLYDAAVQVEAEARCLWQAEAGGSAPLADGCPPPLLAAGPWGDSLGEFAAHIRRHGAGVLGRHGFFRWGGARASGAAHSTKTPGAAASSAAPPPAALALRPVLNPDPVRLAHLCGYEDQRSVVIANTLAFLEGKAANNLLLYGDRGTGKSATVKAVCHEYLDRGLRLLELRKEDMAELPAIMEFTASRGMRFIIFIDDLSFEDLDDSFISFKALLEGGLETRPANTLVYATSNRRHLVKEHMAETEARSFDTTQEQLSLADRFGLTVIFTAPSQEDYLKIACFIAEKHGLAPDEQFRQNALRWEKWFNGRSPRSAAQFVDWAAAGMAFPWE